MANHRLSSGNINFKCVHAFASRTRTNLVYHENKSRITGFELFRRQQVVPVQFRSFWRWGVFLSSASVWICCAIDRCGACEQRLPVAKLLVISFILANKSVTKYLLLCSLPRGQEGPRLPTTRSAGGLSVLSPTATFIVVVKTFSSGITNDQNDLFQFCHETFVSLHLCSAEDSV